MGYDAKVAAFLAFCSHHSCDGHRLAGGGDYLTESMLLAWLHVERHVGGNSGTTLAGKVSAVNNWFGSSGKRRTSEFAKGRVSLLVAAYKREDSARQAAQRAELGTEDHLEGKLALSVVALRDAVSAARLEETPSGRALACVLQVEFFYALRVSELLGRVGVVRAAGGSVTALGAEVHGPIRRRDVCLLDDLGHPLAASVAEAEPWRVAGAELFLRSAKNDQHFQGATTALFRGGRSGFGARRLCPVEALLELLRAGPGGAIGAFPDLPLAVYWNRDGEACAVKREEVAAAVKRAAAGRGENAAEYGTHSLRRGGATAFYGGGGSAADAAELGRWKEARGNKTVYTYLGVARLRSRKWVEMMLSGSGL